MIITLGSVLALIAIGSICAYVIARRGGRLGRDFTACSSSGSSCRSSGAELLKGAAAKQVAVDGLRSAILNGEGVPGQRLVETELVDRFGVTRTSVRAAMDDLAAEGLTERIPNRGTRVRTVSLEEAVGILECRQVLEGLIAARAAARITDDQKP